MLQVRPSRMQNAECRMQNAECRMQNAECRMQNAECTMRCAMQHIHKSAAIISPQVTHDTGMLNMGPFVASW